MIMWAIKYIACCAVLNWGERERERVRMEVSTLVITGNHLHNQLASLVIILE